MLLLMVDPLDPLKPETLAAARKARDVKRIRLAELSGIDQTTIWRIENGKVSTSVETWAQIVNALVKLPLKAAA